MFEFRNPHPQGLRVGDCIKRAYVIASGINYHDMTIMLNRFKRQCGNDRNYWKLFIEQVLLGEKNKGDMQHEFYGHRYTVDDWARYWCNDVSILRCSKHLVTTKNGNYYDTWDGGKKGVYIAYFIPSYEKIVNHIRTNHKALCKGLTLEKQRYSLL